VLSPCKTPRRFQPSELESKDDCGFHRFGSFTDKPRQTTSVPHVGVVCHKWLPLMHQADSVLEGSDCRVFADWVTFFLTGLPAVLEWKSQ